MTTGPLGGPYEARSGCDTQQVALPRKQGSSLPHKVVTVSVVICSNPIYILHEDTCLLSRYEPWLMLQYNDHHRTIFQARVILRWSRVVHCEIGGEYSLQAGLIGGVNLE
jgi:hypothetical protein